MPNHYTNILFVYDGYEEVRDLATELVAREWGTKPFDRAVPMPAELNGTQSPRDNPNWHDWQIANRGVKWDAYDVQAPVRLPGDSMVTQITFCSAWNAPNEAVRDAMVAELFEVYGASRVVWLGLDPYDDSHAIIGIWQRPPKPRLALVPTTEEIP
jgi:hypothetical protein